MYTFHRGHRDVLIIGPLVFKFPRVRLRSMFRVWGWYLTGFMGRNQGFWRRCKSILSLTFDDLCGSLIENIREAKAFVSKSSPYLPKLYFPFLLVNIYRREEGVGTESFEIYNITDLVAKLERTGNAHLIEALNKIDHHAFHYKNFSFNGSNVISLDYGGKGFFEFITLYGDVFEKVIKVFLKPQQ